MAASLSTPAPISAVSYQDVVFSPWGLFVLVAYVGAAWLGLHFNSVSTFAAPVWAPTGIALAAIYLGGYRLAPWVALGAFLINVYTGAPFFVACLIGIGNMLEAVAGVYLINRFTSAKFIFRRLRDTLIFLLIALVAPVVSATLGVGSLWLASQVSTSALVVTWVAWWAGDVLGMLIFAPLFITWFLPYTYPVFSWRYHLIELALLIATFFGVNALAFMRSPVIPPTVPLLYLVSLPLAWFAVRFGPRGVTAAVAADLLIAVWATANGTGPFVSTSYETGTLFLQLYIGATAVTFLAFASIVKELRTARDEIEDHVADLEYALRKIRSEDSAKTEFLAVLAHELRNPLAPVVSALELINLKGPQAPESVQAVAIIEKQVQTISLLLNDLLDISRISRKKVALERQRVDVRVAVRHALETVGGFMQTQQHKVVVSLGQKPLWVDADPLRLEQILVNLLNNAAKYTDPGGVIRVSTRKDDSWVALSVKDNGVGIKREMLDKIFEPFIQLTRDTVMRSAGLGIGLSLTKHLVELHGGTIEVESGGSGKGSEFVVRMPALVSRPPARGLIQTVLKLEKAAPPARSAPRKLKRRTILVVDDNAAAAESLARLLEYRGHRVYRALDGPTALTTFSKYKPQVVLLDIGLPQMDGYEVARKLRALKRPALLVALTGYGLEEDKKKSRLAGFDHHLVKPVSLKDFEPLLQ